MSGVGKKSFRDIFSGRLKKPRHVLGESLINALVLAVWFAPVGKGIRHSFLHCSTSYICDDMVADGSTPTQCIAHNKC